MRVRELERGLLETLGRDRKENGAPWVVHRWLPISLDNAIAFSYCLPGKIVFIWHKQVERKKSAYVPQNGQMSLPGYEMRSCCFLGINKTVFDQFSAY